MVRVIKEDKAGLNLKEITKREVALYAGFSPLARLYPILDDENQAYAVVIIENQPAERAADVMVMARVVGDKIVIEEDTTDKPLVDALMVNAGIPREQIVLAYRGEKIPD